MEHPLLAENDAKRLNVRLPLLICFAMFNAWQMGVGYYSGKSLSVVGRIPFTVDVGNLTVLIAAGYLLSIAVMVFLPRIIVWAERITVGVALLSALALFLSFSGDVLSVFYRLHYFCGCFMIGFETALIVNLFTEETAILHTTIAYSATLIIPVLLQNDFIYVHFWIFRLVIVIACTMQLYFFCKLPGKSWPRYAKKSDGLICPKSFFGMVFIMSGLTALMTFFGNAIAETISHGISIFYISAALYGLIVFFLWKRLDIEIIRCAFVLIGVATIGFITAIVSLYIPSFSLVSCVLLAAGMTALGVQPLYGVIMAKRYPSRYIAPAIIGICFVGLLIHTALLPFLSENPTIQYIVYLSIAVVLAVLFFMLMPYLFYSFKNHPILETKNPEADEQLRDIDEKTKESINQQIEVFTKSLKALTLDELTYQELRIAELSLQGYTYAEIGKALDIKLNTVKWYMKIIYGKLQIHSKAELFNLAHKQRAENREQFKRVKSNEQCFL